MEAHLEMVVGNTCIQAEAGTWAWEMFLRAGKSASLVDHITFHLHKTFRDPVVLVREADENGSFQSGQHRGWGVFEVGVEIHWNPELVQSQKTTLVSHMLSFSSPETVTSFTAALIVQPQACDRIAGARDRSQARRDDIPQAAHHPDLDPEVQELSRNRPELDVLLSREGFLDRENPRFFHGRMCPPDLPAPREVWKSDRKPRDGSASWLTATEFEDSPDILEHKVKLLASLLLQSKKTVAYTGAGISVPAGIGQAAVGSAGGSKTVDALPTLTHYTMSALNAKGLLHGWVQQNHDGLPQKAGYPQEAINEIHGSWFDPSNPVVLYSGTLRGELCEDMQMLAKTSDLTLVLGTSLTGLNADQVATTPAKRSLRGRSLGTVIISPQQTEHDGEATLRIFAKADDVMRLLAPGLGLRVRSKPKKSEPASRVAVPYDRRGARSQHERTYWDLRPGQQVTVSEHNNIEGAQQRSFLHIKPGTVGRVLRRDEYMCSFVIDFEGAHMRLGLWWLDAAKRGAVEHLPVVNITPWPCEE